MEKEKMQELTKKTNDKEIMQLKEQPVPLKSNILRPFSSGPSAFRPWQPSLKSDLGHIEKDQINVGSAVVGADVDDQAQQKMDPERLKRILAHRASEKKSRTRKAEYMTNLERMQKSFQDKLSFLRPQMEAYKKKMWLLQIEHHQLKLDIAILQKKGILREVEIERNQAEVNRLLEVQKKQAEQASKEGNEKEA